MVDPTESTVLTSQPRPVSTLLSSSDGPEGPCPEGWTSVGRYVRLENRVKSHPLDSSLVTPRCTVFQRISIPKCRSPGGG